MALENVLEKVAAVITAEKCIIGTPYVLCFHEGVIKCCPVEKVPPYASLIIRLGPAEVQHGFTLTQWHRIENALMTIGERTKSPPTKPLV